jgi:DNA-binding response OmpR family regulator
MLSRKRRILCADDHADTTFLLRTIFEKEGYEVRTAQSVAESMTLAKFERFDLFLLDQNFPDGTGIRLCCGLHDLHPHIPILFFSGAASEPERQRGIKAGAQAYLIKPNDLGKLRETVKELVVKAEASQTR